MKRNLPEDSPEVQTIIRRHHGWLKQFWKPTRKFYVGHSQLIVDSELRKAYEAHAPLLRSSWPWPSKPSPKTNWRDVDACRTALPLLPLRPGGGEGRTGAIVFVLS